MASNAEYTLTLSDIGYSLDGNNLTITYYTNTTEKDIIIPVAFVDGENTYIVTSIGNSAFNGNSLTHVTIPHSVTSIDNFAFANNSLTHLTIPHSLTSIGDFVFFNNSLTSVAYLDTTPVNYSDILIDHPNSVDLIIPAGSQANFVAAGWTGFKSYTSPSTTYTFTGTGTDWHTASNWDQNAVPSAASDIIVIPTGKTVTTTSAVTFDSMTIAAGSTFKAGGTVTGDVTYQKTLTSDWELVTAPLSGETVADYITNNIGLATGNTSGNRAFSYYDNNFTGSKYWNYYNGTTNVIAGNLTSGTGFATKLGSAGNVSLTGSINTGNITKTVSIGTKKAYNLVGNPFTAYYSSSDFLTDSDNTSVLAEQTLWIRSGSGYTAINNANAQMLAPGHGFFVKANGSGSVSFKTANQSHSSTITPTGIIVWSKCRGWSRDYF